MSNTTGAASETETAYSPDHRSSFSIFNGIRVKDGIVITTEHTRVYL
jgi:hypothetical protein